MPLPGEYGRLSFQDRVAAMIMAAVYTREHIDLTVRVPTKLENTNRNLRPAQRLSYFRKQVAEAVLAYQDLYPDALVIYRQAKGDPEPKSVTEVNYDTTAVVIDRSTLYIALNYKVRIMSPFPDKLNVTPDYVAFGAPGSGAREAAVDMLRRELMVRPHESVSSAQIIERVSFIGVDGRFSDAREAAAPHAEMQLLSHLSSLRRPLGGLRLGVSKACCARCAKELMRRGVRYTPRPGNDDPVNWSYPIEITTRVVEEVRCRLHRSWT